MAELDTIYLIIAAQALGMLAITAVYNALRLRKEERKVKAAEASAAANKAAFDSMTVYHAKRLEIEEEKLELARGNAPSQGVLVREHSRVTRPSPRPMPEATEGESDRTMEAIRRTRSEMMSDEEFAARIKKIREIGQ